MIIGGTALVSSGHGTVFVSVNRVADPQDRSNFASRLLRRKRRERFRGGIVGLSLYTGRVRVRAGIVFASCQTIESSSLSSEDELS